MLTCLETCFLYLFLQCSIKLLLHCDDIMMKPLQSWKSSSRNAWRWRLQNFWTSSGSVPNTSALLLSKHSAWSLFHSVYVQYLLWIQQTAMFSEYIIYHCFVNPEVVHDEDKIHHNYNLNQPETRRTWQSQSAWNQNHPHLLS